MDLCIREITANDAAAVCRLSKQLGYEISDVQTASNIQSLLKNKNADAFVALHDNTMVGWINVAYTVTIESMPFCEIRGLIVDERYRRNNIGKMLIEEAKHWCKQKKCERLRLRCNAARKETHNFYLHLGFTEKKQQKVFEIEVP